MQGSLEEKEKCVRKLSEMEKFLPFLDFMIDKIKKKSSEISLECQLNKLEGMRSMIAEKNGRYSLDAIIKVEDIIEKLIVKLDYKEQCNSLKESNKLSENPKINQLLLKVSNSVANESSLAASVSVIPSSTTTTISITNAASLCEVTTVDSRPKDSHTNTVDIIMKTLKSSVDYHSNNNVDLKSDKKQLIDSLERSCVENSLKNEAFSKNLELNLDKDLDGFELTDCYSLSETKRKNTVIETDTENLGKVLCQTDLLSSSREKLLKSLQKKLNPSNTGILSQSSGDNKIVKSDLHSISASSLLNKSPIFIEEKSESEFLVPGFNSEKIVNSVVEKYGRKENLMSKAISSPIVSPKSCNSDNFISDSKFYCDLESGTSDHNSKQKLREKLSADICEVYRVPGKSVGGSLRSLKETKDNKKSMHLEEEELFKPDKITAINKSRRSSIENTENISLLSFSSSKNSETCDKTDGKKNLKEDSGLQYNEGFQKNKKKDEKDFVRDENKKEVNQFKKHSNEIVEEKFENKNKNLCRNTIEEKKDKLEEINSFHDEQVLEIVKENLHSFSQPSKSKPIDSKKTHSSPFNDTVLPDSELFNLINEDSFQDLNEFTNDKQYFSNKPKEKMKTLTNSTSLSKINNAILNDSAIAKKLIEEKNNTVSDKKKKGLLFNHEDKFDTFKTVRLSNRDPRKKQVPSLISTESCSGNLENKSEFENKKNEDGPFVNKQHNATLQLMNINQQKFSNDIYGTLIKNTNVTKKQYITQSLEKKHLDSLNEASFSGATLNFLSQENQLHYDSKYSKKVVKPVKKDFSAAKSYAEYRHMKSRHLEKCQNSEKEKKNVTNYDNVSEKKKERNAMRDIRSNDETQKISANLNLKHIRKDAIISYSNLKAENTKQKKNCREDFKKNVDELNKNVVKNKKQSVDSDDLISPLEKLYQNETKSTTNRGYGLQNFKIPKKMRSNNINNSEKKDSIACEKKHTFISNKQENIKNDIEKSTDEIKTTATSKVEIQALGKTFDKQELNSRSSEISTCSNAVANNFPNSNHPVEDVNIKKNCQVVSNLVEAIKKNVSHSQKVNKEIIQQNESLHNFTELKNIASMEAIKKCEVVECNSSTENINITNSKNKEIKENEEKEKCTLVSKDEITQEFVEALIRKSFQSGEGKLLLAQAKLFEEFTRKLNSKKLKTIQKIINSESDSNSLSSSDSFSEDDKKKRGKKLERKNIKKKKKNKKNKKQKKEQESAIDSSTEEEKEENIDSVKNEKYVKERLNTEKEQILTCETFINEEKKKNDLKDIKETCHVQMQKKANKQNIKKKRKTIDFGQCISKQKRQRRQRQKKLIEQILSDDSPLNKLEEPENVVPIPEDAEKESKEKPKSKPKAKVKTELDRLHDDIRSMFICEGVVTATGQRMCRMLKESGGNVKNLDIVKESAKMVEEEKLKKVQTCESSVKLRSRSSAFSRKTSKRTSDKLFKSCDQFKSRISFDYSNTKKLDSDTFGPLVSTENTKKQPFVVMHKVDLNNFGYGKKISEGCLKFNLCPGRNIAYRGKNRKVTLARTPDIFSEHNLAKNVYMARNKRKCLLLKSKIIKKNYKKKSLLEVLKYLPLKLAKMKHLEIVKSNKTKNRGEKKNQNFILTKSLLRKKRNQNYCFSEEIQKTQISQNLSLDLLDYAFDKKKSIYFCILCDHETSNITRHYKTEHAESEVLISRLSKAEAQKAIMDSKENNYNMSFFAGETSSNVNSVNDGLIYKCRMCSQNRTADFNSFFFHITGHTGEYRYSCPSKDCSFSANTREYMKIHILSRHSDNWSNLYNEIIELFSIPSKCHSLFGYLCCKCNFVQVFESNLKNHIQKSHSNDENVSIIKIDMSDKPFILKNKNNDIRINNNKKSLSKTDEFWPESKNEEEKEDFIDVEAIECDKVQENDISETLGLEKSVNNNLDKYDSVMMSATKEKEISRENLENTSENANYSRKVESILEDNLKDESVNLENSYYMTDSEESKEKNENQVKLSKTELLRNSTDIKTQALKLKVGPLQVQIFGKTDSLYECHVKNCLFSTKIFDLFEKHVKISHSKTKWDVFCEICLAEKTVKCEFSTFTLTSVLNHLKFHENVVLKKNLSQEKSEEIDDKILENLFQNEDKDLQNDLLIKNSHENLNIVKQNEENIKMEKSKNVDASFPLKPLLRVRNFFGDQLSTPKKISIENEVVLNDTENTPLIESCNADENSPKMFTIENVRSLQGEENLEVNEVDTEFLPIKSNELPKIVTPETVKPIVIRSCPSRPIAIQPDSNSLPIESNLKLVKTSSVNPVVLGTLSNVTPIRILSTASSPNYKLSVQSIVVSASNSFLTKTNTVSVIRPVPPLRKVPVSTCTTSISSVQVDEKSSPLILTEGQEIKEKQFSINNSNNNTSQVSCDKNKSSVKRIRPKVYRSNRNGNSSSQVSASSSSLCSSEANNKGDAQKISRPLTGNKSVKDAKIYQEMLTKAKLCHLFKCMAVECSFTCNSENIFTQHLGLHEAQRRMKSQKTWKTVSFYSNSKLKKAFNWQQCAYCCEVLANSSFALSRHVIIEHGHCIYQCAFCFYRAVSQSYVEIHQNLAHAQFLKNNRRIIYKCKSFSRAPSPASALEKQGRRQSIRPYHCDQCGKKFFITQEFMNHLTTEHQSVTAYTCHICKNLCFKADRLIVHYKLHSYCTYQCAYCLHGTETEKEMVFHLCNFHFSQPAYMYVRALADNQKSNGSQLDSLKVIHYESDTLNLQCIEEADLDDQTASEYSKDNDSRDFSIIVAELGITTESGETNDVTPLIKELACFDKKNCENLSVKNLLPNAQFSSENDSLGENCSVLISSGLSFNGSEQNEEKEISIPLGQLNVETVTVQNTPTIVSSPKNTTSDKNMKLNEIIINIHHKENTLLSPNVENNELKEKPNVTTAVHKMPPVVLTRITDPKNVYPSKSGHIAKKMGDDSFHGNENIKKREENILASNNFEHQESFFSQDKEKLFSNLNFAKDVVKIDKEIEESQSLIPSIKNLCTEHFEKNNSNVSSFVIDNLPKIADVCSLSSLTENQNFKESSKTIDRIQSKMDSSFLKSPVIAIENSLLDNQNKNSSSSKIDGLKQNDLISQTEKEEEKISNLVESPDLIILENEKTVDKTVLTVTIDSEDEKETESFEKYNEIMEKKFEKIREITEPNETIRKEMELLRNQITNETECLLIDDTDNENSSPDLPVINKPKENKKESENLLSPIEEAICSLNKKLEEEGEKLKQEKFNEFNKNETESSFLPRTRSSVKERFRKVERTIKNEFDDSNSTSTSGLNVINKKNSKFKIEYSGKNLYICGNEKCFFAAENEGELKDHLFVCDCSRDSLTLLCPHCFRQIKQINAYIEHLKHHGKKKYSCGLCSFKTAVETSIIRHIKQKHKCGQVKSVPGDSPKADHLIFYPKNYKLDKVDFEVNGYSPGDEDKLPLQAVYQVNVKCAKCPYFTKVRSNMVRHLKIHVKSAETEGVVVVPSTAPTNPVPCLDTKERMFDKMTNLAASSQLAQAKEKISVETLAPEEQAKLPHFIPEQMRYKCCLPDCNYITVDDGMLKHHIKALHAEINYYSCPHCRSTVHIDVRHVTLDKIGHHLKYHDSKLYKCAHCIYFHYQKTVVEKHTLEKHPDRRYFVHIVRESKGETSTSEELQSSEPASKVWKCGLCEEFYSLSKGCILEHLVKSHNTKSKYKCKLCDMKSNHCNAFFSHFASKHVGEKVTYLRTFMQVNSSSSESYAGNIEASSEHFDTTPLWQRGTPRVRHIRGILIEEAEIKTKKSKKVTEETNETEVEITDIEAPENSYFCPLCSDKKPFYTRNPEIFRSHLYQELNYQQFACILCGKMFVDKKDYEKHHSKLHQDKPQCLKQTKEDGEITFWVDKMIAKQKEKIETKKRRLSEQEPNEESRGLPKKKKEN